MSTRDDLITKYAADAVRYHDLAAACDSKMAELRQRAGLRARGWKLREDAEPESFRFDVRAVLGRLSRRAGSYRHRALIADRKVEALTSGDAVPVAFFAERFRVLEERGELTLSLLGERLGLVSPKGKVDVSHVSRLLGIKPWTNKKGYPPMTSDTVSRDLAYRLADALELPPGEVDDQSPEYTHRPQFRVFVREGCIWPGCDSPVADDSLPRHRHDSCRGSACELHAPTYSRLRAEFKTSGRKKLTRAERDARAAAEAHDTNNFDVALAA